MAQRISSCLDVKVARQGDATASFPSTIPARTADRATSRATNAGQVAVSAEQGWAEPADNTRSCNATPELAEMGVARRVLPPQQHAAAVILGNTWRHRL